MNLAAKKAAKPAAKHGRWVGNMKITLEVKESPCRVSLKGYKRFAKFSNGTTVAAAKEAGL